MIGEILDQIAEFTAKIARIPVDAYIDIESKVSTKGMVLVMWTVTICMMMLNGATVPKAFGDLYTVIIYAYFGVGAVKKLQEVLSTRK